MEKENGTARIDQEQEELESSIEERRQQAKFTKRIASIINLIESETIQEYFPTCDADMNATFARTASGC
jgi:hypothetical protein